MATNTAPVISAFGGTLPTVDSVTNGGTTDPAGETVEITLNVGESTTRTINGVAVTDTIDKGVAKVVAVDASVAGEPTYALADNIESGKKYCISDGNGNYLSVNASGATVNESEKDSPTEWTIKGSGSSYTIKDETTGYYLCYNTSGDDLIASKNSTYRYWSYSSSGFSVRRYNRDYYIRCYNNKWYVLQRDYGHGLPYTKTTTTAEEKTSVTITGKAPGYTTTTVGGVTYNITVNAIEESKSLTVSSGKTAALDVPALDESIVGNTTTTYDVTIGSEYITVNENDGTITAKAVTENKTATVAAKVKNASGVVLATYTYNVTITKEDLTEVTSITVEYWITNARVNTTASTATETTISASVSTVYSEAGALLSSFVPASAKRVGEPTENLVFWKGVRHPSTNKQTTDKGDNKTLEDNDFNYVRYWNGKWSFSVNGVEWFDYNSGDQIVAYYLQKTDVTDEITTEVVDWGNVPYTGLASYLGTKYILVDFAVMYQSGERIPSTFPTGNTVGFHCDDSDTNTVHEDSDGNYYREIASVRAKETADYEVYMITLTPTKTALPGLPSAVESYDYNYDEEKVVWVDDEANLGAFTDKSKHYTSISKNSKYSYRVGGEPIINGFEVYRLNGMLVTNYIRAKATPDSLTVHYMDRTNGDKEFYSYPINVNQGTTFKTGPYLPEIPEAYGIPTHINNGDVVNSLGKTQYVSSVLATMPEINVAYRYSSYECVEVVRREDGKDLYLYYTFKNTHSFVVDFGVPLHLTKNDIIISGDWTSYTATQGKYGTVEYDGTQIGGGITYTPTEVMQGRDEIAVTLNGENGKATHFIYLYPATNVLYEENVITNPVGSGWTTVTSVFTPATDVEGNEITTQSTEKLGNENLHGYDVYYSENTGFSGGSAYKAELTLPAGQKNIRTSGELSFTFTGTGFDLISECGKDTGALLVKVYRVNADNTKTLAHGFLVDTYFSGDETYIKGNGILDYQVPVVRDFIKKTVDDELVDDYGTYEVNVKGFLLSNSGAVVNSTNAISTYSSQNVVEETLASLGIPEEDFDLYEVVYMDDNSVLNGGTGAETSVVKSDIATFVKDIAMDNALELNDATDGAKTANVYVDGIRIYNTIDPSKQPGYKTSEKNTEYYNVYDFVLNSSAGTSDQWDTNSAIYIEKDGNTSLYKIADYKKQGPENEIYLTSGNAVVFALDGYDKATSATVHVAAKAVSGNHIFAGTDIYHSTELYYDVTKYINHSDEYGYYIVLKNDDNNNSVLSISGIKVSSNIQLVANEELGDYVVKKLNPAEDDKFKPDEFSASIPASVKKGRRFVVNISASTDVDSVTVTNSDGTIIGTKTKSQADNSGDVLRYSIIAKAPNETGTYKIYVYATNENKINSAKHELTITVK